MKRITVVGWLVVANLVVLVANPLAANGDTLLSRTERFDAAGGWTGLRNINASTGNNFGFRASNVTGGASGAGEAGGTFARTTDVANYADTNLGGVLALGDRTAASGELIVTSFSNWNNGIFIGYRSMSADSTDSSMSNFFGFQVSEGQNLSPTPSAAFGVAPTLFLSDGARRFGPSIGFNELNGNLQWTWNYDPTVNNGRVTLQVFNSGGGLLGTSTLDLSAGDRSIGASFDAFGIGSGGIGGTDATNQVTVFIDNVTYTTALVPEPSSAALVLFGLLAVGGAHRLLGKQRN